jgi:hypothetical protein
VIQVERDAPEIFLLARMSLSANRIPPSGQAPTNLLGHASQGHALIILEQSLKVVEFNLRALWIGKAATQFLQNAADPLDIDLVGNLHGEIVAELAPVQRPSQRIALAAAALLTSLPVAGTIALSVAVARLHRLRETLGGLAHTVQSTLLRIHRAVSIALAEPAVGIAHGGIRIGQPVTIVLVAALLCGIALLSLLAALALLALLAALARGHAALGQFLLQLLEPVAQSLLILLQIAHARIALLAARSIASRILPLLEGLVAQLLLLANHVAKLVQRLLHVVVAGLAGLRHLQILQHLLQLVEQLLGRVLVAGARQPLHALDHVVEVLLAHDLGIGIERAGQLLRIVAHLLGELAQEIIQRRAQVLGQLLDLFVAGAAFQRLLEGVLRGPQRLVDVGDVAHRLATTSRSAASVRAASSCLATL